ncbi:hypothetical protein J7K27_02495 [Candidatus Bathyarchaeota archaeon]|nr:hypothetical protein [Candidatus Bathyarchaeota archaeon]
MNPRIYLLGTEDNRLILYRGAAASSSVTTRSSPKALFVGAYWDGTSSVNRIAAIFHRMIDTTPKSEIAFQIAGSDYLKVGDNGIIASKNTLPSTDNSLDLGSSSYRWANLHVLTANANAVQVNDSTWANQLRIDLDETNNRIRFRSPNSWDFQFHEDVLPSADNTFSLGTSSLRWKDIHIKGNVYLYGLPEVTPVD